MDTHIFQTARRWNQTRQRPAHLTAHPLITKEWQLRCSLAQFASVTTWRYACRLLRPARVSPVPLAATTLRAMDSVKHSFGVVWVQDLPRCFGGSVLNTSPEYNAMATATHPTNGSANVCPNSAPADSRHVKSSSTGGVQNPNIPSGEPASSGAENAGTGLGTGCTLARNGSEMDHFARIMVEECRQLGLPCVPVVEGPWFAIEYLAKHWLMIDRCTDLVAACKQAGVPMLMIRRKPCIQLKSIVRVCQVSDVG